MFILLIEAFITSLTSFQFMIYKSFCEDIAKEAGNIIKKHFVFPMNKVWKEDCTPITKTDMEVNKLIITKVHELFPGHDVLGEEESSLENKGEYVWVCDPVDGTIPFSHGVPTAVFSLALVHNGIPLVAIIYDPWVDRMYYAEKGKGAFLNGRKIHVSDVNSFSCNVVGMAKWKNSKYNISELSDVLIAKECHVMQVLSIIYMGMLVASGELCAVIFPGNTAHDGASLKLLVEEAGGIVTDLYGNEQRYDQEIKGFIASNGLLHNALVKMVSEIL